jgi:hypothetical protein
LATEILCSGDFTSPFFFFLQGQGLLRLAAALAPKRSGGPSQTFDF